ncbi:MAG: asparaginase domain-containing protein [Alphaproteobacteria bacterium]|nr:asparaginase domain-containing protein [Alphaproteobacteria bacterium]
MTNIPEISCGFLVADDLANLTYLTPEKVQAWVDDLNRTTDEELAGRQLVGAIGTGGTISMKVENGIRLPDLDFQGVFSRANSGLNDRFVVKALDAFQLDSADMDYSHIRDVAIALTYAWKNLKVSIMGFLIPHGTDTLQYSAAATSLIMGQGLPFSVVYTASQKPIQYPMNDAATNVKNALYTLEALHANNMAEVVVVMGDYAVLGTSAVKIDDMAANAFDAPLHRYIATFNRMEYPIKLADFLAPARGIPFTPTIWKGDYSHTLVIRSSLGLDPDSIARQLKDKRVQAVIWFAYGAGTIYQGIGDAMMPIAKERNIPVFITSPVNTDYKVDYASGLEMMKQGVVPLHMTLPSALAKVEIALRMHAGDVDAMCRFMVSNYVGEVPTEQTRFVPVR